MKRQRLSLCPSVYQLHRQFCGLQANSAQGRNAPNKTDHLPTVTPASRSSEGRVYIDVEAKGIPKVKNNGCNKKPLTKKYFKMFG